MRRNSPRRQVTQSRRFETTKRLPFSSGQGTRRSFSLQASELWEDWDRAEPFTAGKDFFNVGDTHDVAFAAAKFGSVHKIPKDFRGWEDLACRVEKDYVRGWVAKDGSRMFLWDDFSEAVWSADHFKYFRDALVRLQAVGYATPRTDLWDSGGYHYVGALGALALLDGQAALVSRKRTR